MCVTTITLCMNFSCVLPSVSHDPQWIHHVKMWKRAAAAATVTNSKPLLNNEPVFWPWACEKGGCRENHPHVQPVQCNSLPLSRLMQTFHRNVSLSVWKRWQCNLTDWTNKLQRATQSKWRWASNEPLCYVSTATAVVKEKPSDSKFNVAPEEWNLNYTNLQSRVYHKIMIPFTFLIWNPMQGVGWIRSPAVKKGFQIEGEKCLFHPASIVDECCSQWL